MKYKFCFISIIGTIVFFSCKKIQSSNPSIQRENDVKTVENNCYEYNSLQHQDSFKKTGRIKQKKDDFSHSHLDLSNRGITSIPDLSHYKNIISLDLSHNKLENINFDRLPKGLQNINFSHNLLSGNLRIEKRFCNKLINLNFSHNQITSVNISCQLNRLDLSYNDINKINLNTTKLIYLDVSNNKNLSNVVDFNPNSIKIIKQKNISVDKPLVFSLSTIKPLH